MLVVQICVIIMIRTIVQDLIIHRKKSVPPQDEYYRRFRLWTTASDFLYLYNKVRNQYFSTIVFGNETKIIVVSAEKKGNAGEVFAG